MKKIILSLALILAPFLFSEPARAKQRPDDSLCRKVFKNETCRVGCDTELSPGGCPPPYSIITCITASAPDRRCVMHHFVNQGFGSGAACYCLELPAVRECPAGMKKTDDECCCIPDGDSQQESGQLNDAN